MTRDYLDDNDMRIIKSKDLDVTEMCQSEEEVETDSSDDSGIQEVMETSEA